MKRILPAIVVSQFFCTSLWFAGNAIMSDIAKQFNLPPEYLGYLTIAVQLGFICGTLLFAMLAISDRYPPSWVFFASAVIASLVNLAMLMTGIHSEGIIIIRFLTGFLLAGIYPVGMKIAADHYERGLGRSLGYLVGALVVGTSFPHFLKSILTGLPWTSLVYATSILSFLGGLIMLFFVPEGPFRKAGQRLTFNAFAEGFRIPAFRAAAFGYFGHMWELYSFWAFVPLMLTAYRAQNQEATFNVPFLSFLIIVAGSIACAMSGIVSSYLGVKRTATIALLASCICCIVSPLFLLGSHTALFLGFLFVWSMAVIADSPMFSTLIAQSAPEGLKGSSITIVTSIGFSVTIISIQLLNMLSSRINNKYLYMILALGPVLALLAFGKGKKILSPESTA